MASVSQGSGKHSGARRAAPAKRDFDPKLLLYAGGITFCVVAWGYLVFAAIDFGSSAREGRPGAWLYLAVACLGAICCLFAGLMIGVRLLTLTGIISTPPGYADPRDPEKAVGGKRAAR